jgi:hypothetical protein
LAWRPDNSLLLFEGDELAFDSSDYPPEVVEEGQLTMALAESAGRYRVRKG